ncbi:acetamidase, partial [Aulographum hederae CBS 113979]
LTEVLFPGALQRADELDKYLKENGKPVGPLHGVPVTVKDQFDVEGYDSTIGYVGRAYKPASKDALMVTLLRDLGAVVIAKTNLPQTIMWCETDNPLWGCTTHPSDANLTPGGSSGGEAAALALHGSILGWGTDIGGSIRIPAHMNGLYGLKPSSGRLPYAGLTNSTDGQEHVPSVVGPLARSLSSITLAVRSVIDTNPWLHDPKCHPLQWRGEIHDEVQTRKLTVGVLLDDGVVKVHPPIKRIILHVASKLKDQGHEIIEWTSDLHSEVVDVMDTYYTSDGGADILADLSVAGEPRIPHVRALLDRAKGKALSVDQYWQLNRRRLAAQTAYLEKWNRTHSSTGACVDAILCPVMPHCAVAHGNCKWVGYTKVWNVLDYSALVLPGGLVDKNLDVKEDYQPRNELDAWNWGLWDPDAMHGLPVGIQLVGRKLEEEKLLGIGNVLDSLADT